MERPKGQLLPIVVLRERVLVALVISLVAFGLPETLTSSGHRAFVVSNSAHLSMVT